MKKGFTLIEMLVVVLIIGVLAAVALPSYETAIEKTRVSEALVTAKAIVDAEARFFQANPNATRVCDHATQLADVDLKGGTWHAGASTAGCSSFRTKNFTYDLGHDGGVVVVYRPPQDQNPNDATPVDKESSKYFFWFSPDDMTKSCWPDPNGSDGTEEGRVMCKFIQAL